MSTLLQSQVFFLISSIGFVILWILVAILLFYLIRTANTFSGIMNKLEKDIDKIGDTTKDLLEDMKNSAVFHTFFRKSKGRRKT